MKDNVYNLDDPVDRVRIRYFLETGQLVACASESVWGLSCDADNPQAVNRLREIKQRPESKGLILVTGIRQHLDFLLDGIPQQLAEKVNNYWPGHTTLLIPDPLSRIPPWIKGNNSKVAVRLSKHPDIFMLSKLWQAMLVSSSANHCQKPPATSLESLRSYFGQDIPIIKGSPGDEPGVSPIIDLESGDTIRQVSQINDYPVTDNG